MLDFHAIRARHLEAYRENARFRRESVQPVARAKVRIEGIKRNTILIRNSFQDKAPFVPQEMLGQRLDLLF